MRHLLLLSLVVLLQSNVLIGQDQMFDICPLKVGETIPETQLKDADNMVIDLSTLVGEKPSVLIFYRGAWCGYCTQHLAELNEIKSEVESLGYQMLGITVDQAEKLTESNIRSESEIPVYSDASLQTIAAFGLDWKVDDAMFTKYKNEYELDLEDWSGESHHSLPVPAIFVVKDGMVQFQYVNPNYRLRLPAETLLAILENS